MKKDEKDKPCCEQRVSALIANENTAFTDNDREWLSTLNEQQVEKLEVNVEQPEPKEEATTLDGFLASAPPSIRSVLNEGLRQLDAKRTSLIQRIVANERNRFDQKQLEGLDTAMLENMAELIHEPSKQQGGFDFSARVPGAVQINEEDEEEPYIPQTLSDVLSNKK